MKDTEIAKIILNRLLKKMTTNIQPLSEIEYLKLLKQNIDLEISSTIGV